MNRINSSILRLFLIGLAFFGLSICTALNLYAQESAKIYHLEGKDFALSLHGERKIFSADTVNNGGVNLEQSGIVHTGPGTFLELQLLPSGTIIKLSENTSLIYNGIDNTGRFEDLGLLYGRIRVVTGEGANQVVVRSGGISTRINSADFGVDYIMENGGVNSSPRPLFNVHVLSGSADVYPYGISGNILSTGSVNNLVVYESESLFLDISSFHTFVRKEALANDVLAYWNNNNFIGVPPLSVSNALYEIQDVPRDEILDTPEFSISIAQNDFQDDYADDSVVVHSVRTYENDYDYPEPIIPVQTVQAGTYGKYVGLGIGILLTVSSAALQVLSHPKVDVISEKDLPRNLKDISFVTLGGGLITTLGAILFNPSKR